MNQGNHSGKLQKNDKRFTLVSLQINATENVFDEIIHRFAENSFEVGQRYLDTLKLAKYQN